MLCNLLKDGLINGHYLVVTIAVFKVHYCHFSLLGVMQSPTVLFLKQSAEDKNMKTYPVLKEKQKQLVALLSFLLFD